MQKILLCLLFFMVFEHGWAETLVEKERIFNQRANASKTPYGLIGGTSDSPIWTGVYAASQAYRYQATQDPEALKQLEEALWALVRLHDVTGIPGLIAKMIEPIKKDAQGNLPAEYFEAPNEPYLGFMWKGGISFDQYVGYIYGITEGYGAAQDPVLKKAIEGVLRKIGNHFIDHQERIQGPLTSLDFDPKITDWLAVRPNELGGISKIIYSRGGRAMYALQLLKAAYVVTKEKRFKNYYDQLIQEKKYDLIVRDYTQGKTEKMVQDNIFFINLFAKFYAGTAVKATTDSLRSSVAQNLFHISLGHLINLELHSDDLNPEVLKNYLMGFYKGHEPIARHANTYWNFMYARVTDGTWASDPCGISEGIDSLLKFPLDNYGQRTNSSDPKIEKYKGLDANFFKGQKWQWFSKNPLPFERRPMHSFAWQHNAFQMDGAYGDQDAPGVAFLVAYWLGRQLGYISEETNQPSQCKPYTKSKLATAIP